MDLDAWINDPPSESEDETVSTNTFETKTTTTNNNNNSTLFSGESYYHGSNLDSHGGDYQKTKNYVELTNEELEKHRVARKESQNMNPYYVKDSSKAKLTQQVYRFLFKKISFSIGILG